MRTTKVSVGTDRYVLEPDEDVDALVESIIEAVRAGGEFIDFHLTTGRLVRILVTASSTISLETVDWDPDADDPSSDDATAIGDGSRLHIDGEYWLE